MSGYDWTSILASGATAVETAGAMVMDPVWDFDNDPIKAITHATKSAARAYELWHLDQARYFTKVGLLLVAAANSPYVKVGASLGELSDTLHVSA